MVFPTPLPRCKTSPAGPHIRPVASRPTHFQHSDILADSIKSLNPSVTSIVAMTPVRARPSMTHSMKRWNGLTRTITEWDGLRKDDDLWIEDGDCNVHLHAQGRSRRGPAFRLDSKTIRLAGCQHLLPQSRRLSTQSDSGYSSESSALSRMDIFVPAPTGTSRDEAFRWHVATRNLFAWMLHQPLVGRSLGAALIDLLERLQFVRRSSFSNTSDCLSYADDMGYMNFAHSPDYALSMLRFAEHFKIRHLWVDSFSHCAGMNESLCLSEELTLVSRVTQALITRSSLKMDLHIERAVRSLGSFLDEDLSASKLGLSLAEREHLEHFRSFVFSFYVAKHGYWPPPDMFGDKEVIRDMHSDFCSLYTYLVDRLSSNDHEQQGPAAGGLCVLQNIQEFDKRHDNKPLPHPLPLLPRDLRGLDTPQRWRGLRQLRLGAAVTREVGVLDARAAHLAATNVDEPEIGSNNLVKAYISFEQECLSAPNDRLSSADARKVRWILIYCVYQTLNSIFTCSPEVRDAQSPSYYMCCSVDKAFPWVANDTLATHPAMRSPTVVGAAGFRGVQIQIEDDFHRHLTKPIIEPDCDRDEYFGQAESLAQPGDGLNVVPSAAITPRLAKSSKLAQAGSLRTIHQSLRSTFSKRRPFSQPQAELSNPRSTLYCYELDKLDRARSESGAYAVNMAIPESRSPILGPEMLEGPFELPADDDSLDLSWPAPLRFTSISTAMSSQVTASHRHKVSDTTIESASGHGSRNSIDGWSNNRSSWSTAPTSATANSVYACSRDDQASVKSLIASDDGACASLRPDL